MSEMDWRERGVVPKVSVLMPVRGCRDSLPMAVASVLAQTISDWELLVVQDDDEPGLDWLDALGDVRVRRLRSGPPGGRGAARQAGLEATSAELLAFLDADDWMYPDRLERQVRLLEDDSELALVAGGMMVEDRDHLPVGIRRGQPTRALRDIYRSDSSGPPILSAACMVRTDLAQQVGYDRNLRRSEDADFFYRYLSGRQYLRVPDIVYCYREFDSFSRAGLFAGLSASTRLRLARVEGQLRRADCRARALFKRWIYKAALLVLGDDWVLRRRLVAAPRELLDRHQRARDRVEHQRQRLATLT